MHRYCQAVAAATFLLIIAGGLVTSTGSGLAVPDWPLSYGQFFPPMIGGIRFEHTHRVIAGTVGILTLILSIWLFRREQRGWVKRLGLAALAAVVVQAVLGGITVLYFLPDIVSVTHACLAQTFFGLTVAIALVTSKGWREDLPYEFDRDPSSLRQILIATDVFLYLQLILGAVVRHTEGLGIAFHIVVALLVLLHVLITLQTASRITGEKKILRPALSLGLLVTIQFFLGLGAFIVKIVLKNTGAVPYPATVFFATAHQATGALVLATALLLTMRVFRRLASRNCGAPVAVPSES
ncbi:MAG: COX15/CtaA family protein [Candidatus Omnitrophica bacterium]|nr:COX15/CtaA family protein [Candidatus Omnitrophota bacterium]